MAGSSAMLKTIDTYLNVRRAAGFKLKSAQYYLSSYARFALSDTHVRADTAIRWAEQGRSEASRAARLQEGGVRRNPRKFRHRVLRCCSGAEKAVKRPK